MLSRIKEKLLVSCRMPIQAKNQDTNPYLCQDELNSSSALPSYLPTLDASGILVTKKNTLP